MPSIAENVRKVQLNLQNCAENSGRPLENITLMAVSKTQPATAIRSAFDCGLRHFGENYLQEALEKIHALDDLAITWHFIGPIQSNKTQAIAEHFDWAHSVDRLKVAKRLNDQRPENLPPLQVCVQVNIDNQPSKSGCHPNDAAALCTAIGELPRLQLRGLMAIPAPNTGIAPFAALAALKTQVNTTLAAPMDTLSMGMSADMPQAIEAGATMVRIGTALFGPRQRSN